MKCLLRAILSFLTSLSLLFSFAACSEMTSWDCPQCDRKGNTGNFCGGCGHARPEDGAINASNFPDENFRKYVSDHFDTDHDGILSDSERKSVTEIDCRESSISDLKGIEYFSELNYLDCAYNQLTCLDVSRNTQLTGLWCSDNQLTSLDVSRNTQLTDLLCYDNQLTSLDVNNTQLTYLNCGGNQLSSLDVSKNTHLTQLGCWNNQLCDLDVSINIHLTVLSCENNQLTNLDVSKNTQLTELWCFGNQLSNLDVSKNAQLVALLCYDNQLTELDLSECPLLIEVFGKDVYRDQNGHFHGFAADASTRIISEK